MMEAIDDRVCIMHDWFLICYQKRWGIFYHSIIIFTLMKWSCLNLRCNSFVTSNNGAWYPMPMSFILCQLNWIRGDWTLELGCHNLCVDMYWLFIIFECMRYIYNMKLASEWVLILFVLEWLCLSFEVLADHIFSFFADDWF